MIPWEPILVALATILGGGGGLYQLYSARATRKKLGAETGEIGAKAAAVISDSAIGMLEPMQKTIDSLEARLDRANSSAHALEERLESTRRELHKTRLELAEANAELEQARRTALQLQTQLDHLTRETP